MDTITIVMQGRGAKVVAGREKRSRQAFKAPGLEVFTLGKVVDYDMVHNLALNYAISINIPARNVRMWTYDDNTEKPEPKNLNQKGLF